MIRINAEIHSSKNSRAIHTNGKGKRWIGKSAVSKADEDEFILQFRQQREEWARMIQGQEYPLMVTLEFRRRTRGRWDYINLAQGLFDAMVAAELIPDDDVLHVIPVFLGFEINPKNPGCDIGIIPQDYAPVFSKIL